MGAIARHRFNAVPIGSNRCFSHQTPHCRPMQLPMMAAAKRHGELVADFETDGAGLGKPQMMRIGRLPAADQAGL